MDLLALADFNLVASHGGFGRAARAEGRPKATLSRRVAELEASLGVRLFERGAGTPKLTEEGRALNERTAALLGELNAVAEDIASGSDRPRGMLRISAPLLFAQSTMGKIAAGFFLSRPEMRVEVTAEDRSVDLVEEGYDLVIRVNPRPEQDLIGRCFLRDRLIVVAAPTLVRPAAGAPVPAIVLGSADVGAPWIVSDAEGLPRSIVPEDLKPFCILVTIVEPGFFRTDFLDGSSVKYGEVAIDDYAEADARQRADYGAHSGRQRGDPKKLGQALLRIVAADRPPLRYAAGSDAVKMTRDVLEKRLAELDRWRDLSNSTDMDETVAA